MGWAMMRSLADFPHPIAGINPRHPCPEERIYASLPEAIDVTGGAFDLVISCLPAAQTANALRVAAETGSRAAVVCAGGFAESGAGGREAQFALEQVVQQTRLRVLGPNTSGFFVPADRLIASFVPAAAGVLPGSVAVVAASGGMSHSLALTLDAARVGIRFAVGLGSGIDLSIMDFVRLAADDPGTSAIALHIETIEHGRKLVEIIKEAVASIPVVALVVGRSDVGEFARSHTGALATSWLTAASVLRQAGAVVVHSDREMVDAVTALSLGRLPPRSALGVGVVTAQAGPGLLLADQLRTAGVELPRLGRGSIQDLSRLLPTLTYQENPVDTGRPNGAFGDVARVVARDPRVGVLAVYALCEPGAIDLTLLGLDSIDPPVVVGTNGGAVDVATLCERLRARGVACFSSVNSLGNAVWALLEDGRRRETLERASPSNGSKMLNIEGPLDEAQLKDLLSRLGISAPDHRVCVTIDDGFRALIDLRPPLVVKVLDASIIHKSEIGGIEFGVDNEERMREAFGRLARYGSGRVLVEETVPPSIELLIGARRDPVFGPVVILGLGGTESEAWADASVRLAPLSIEEATTMPADLRAKTLLDGWRGGPAYDAYALGNAIASLGDLLVGNPSLAELEVNPLRVTPSGSLVALDAVATLIPSRGGKNNES